MIVNHWTWPTGAAIYAPDFEQLQHWAFIEAADSMGAGFIDAPLDIPAGSTVAYFEGDPEDIPCIHPTTVKRGEQ